MAFWDGTAWLPDGPAVSARTATGRPPRRVAPVVLTLALVGLVLPIAVATASVPSTWTSPEGTRIEIDTAGPWTIDGVYAMLVENGLDATVGATLTVRVQDTYASQTSGSTSTSGGRYSSYRSVITLKGVDSNFASKPNAILAHELGHAWAMYHLYVTQQGDWGAYLAFRGLTGDPLLDSSYSWSKNELIADDYRLVLGSASAETEMPGYINALAPHPSTFEGFADWFRGVWAGGTAVPAPSATPGPLATTPPPASTPAPTAPPASPAPSAAPTATAAPTAEPTAVPSTPAPTPEPTAAPTATPAATPEPTPAPAADLVTGLSASPTVVVTKTTISFRLAATGLVEIRIVNKRGQPIRALVAGSMAEGAASLEWDRTNDRGQKVAKGAYRLEVRSTVGSATELDTLTLTVR